MAHGLARFALLAAVVSIVGCASDKVSGPSEAAVEERLFTAMNHDDYGSAGDIVGELVELHDRQPDNYRATFLLGAASLWWLAEVQRPGSAPNPLIVMSQSIPLILNNFADVVQNDPQNRPVAMALLGAFLADAQLDRATGFALVDQAVAIGPEVGLFQRMHTRRFAPATDSLTADAVEAGFQFWERCIGGPVDRDNPDFTGKVRPPTTTPGQSFCWGSPRVPHGYEGTWLIFGDLLVKAGKLNAARRAYLNAQLGPNYDRWLHKSALEERLRSDLAARQATYADPLDQSKWAPIGLPPFNCTQCHASAP